VCKIPVIARDFEDAPLLKNVLGIFVRLRRELEENMSTPPSQNEAGGMDDGDAKEDVEEEEEEMEGEGAGRHVTRLVVEVNKREDDDQEDLVLHRRDDSVRRGKRVKSDEDEEHGEEEEEEETPAISQEVLRKQTKSLQQGTQSYGYGSENSLLCYGQRTPEASREGSRQLSGRGRDSGLPTFSSTSEENPADAEDDLKAGSVSSARISEDFTEHQPSNSFPPEPSPFDAKEETPRGRRHSGKRKSSLAEVSTRSHSEHQLHGEEGAASAVAHVEERGRQGVPVVWSVTKTRRGQAIKHDEIIVPPSKELSDGSPAPSLKPLPSFEKGAAQDRARQGKISPPAKAPYNPFLDLPDDPIAVASIPPQSLPKLAGRNRLSKDAKTSHEEKVKDEKDNKNDKEVKEVKAAEAKKDLAKPEREEQDIEEKEGEREEEKEKKGKKKKEKQNRGDKENEEDENKDEEERMQEPDKERDVFEYTLSQFPDPPQKPSITPASARPKRPADAPAVILINGPDQSKKAKMFGLRCRRTSLTTPER